MENTNIKCKTNKADRIYICNMKEAPGKYRRCCQIRRKHLLGKMKEGVAAGPDVKVDIFDQQIET